MSSDAGNKTVNILLVEDNPGDVRLTREAFKEAKLLNRMDVCDDGEQALMYLRREGPYADAPTPDMILLDLNLPRVDGREVLRQIKTDPNLRRIPVVVLTTSSADEDVLRAYDLAANCYVTKPVDFERFIEVIRSLEEFWLTVVRLPNTPSARDT